MTQDSKIHLFLAQQHQMIPIKSRLSTWTDNAHFCVWPLTPEQPPFFSLFPFWGHSIQARRRLRTRRGTNQSVPTFTRQEMITLSSPPAATERPRHLVTAIVLRLLQPPVITLARSLAQPSSAALILTANQTGATLPCLLHECHFASLHLWWLSRWSHSSTVGVRTGRGYKSVGGSNSSARLFSTFRCSGFFCCLFQK